jgi:ankyrin repeat protein
MSTLDDVLRAVYRKDRAALEQLSCEQVNMRDADGRTTLMHAILAEDADPSIVRLLIDRGADVNAADSDQRWSALHFGARDQKPEIVRQLLEVGAAVDPIDAFGNTPLWRAVMEAGSSLDTIKELLRHGADPHRKNSRGIAPINLARDMGRDDIVALFEGTAAHQ